MKGPTAAGWIWMTLGTALVATAFFLAFIVDLQVAIVAGAGGVLALGAGLASWGKNLGAAADQERHQKGPGVERRRVLIGLGAMGAAAVAGGLIVPAAVRTAGATARLRETGWGAGVRVVDDQGRAIPAETVTPGSLITVYPEGRLGDSRAQALLVGAEPERIRLPAEQTAGAPEGVLAYSKLCTHMACPVGLYQESSGTVVCPCHQAVFDLFGGGEAVFGPARRPLPRLPIGTDEEGYLIAVGDFTGPVGTGFWSAR